MDKFTQLGLDRDGDPSSQPLVKSGLNRGRRRKEIGGKWKYMSSYCFEHRRLGSSSNHAEWCTGMLELGYRVGYNDHEGVRSFYVFLEDG